MQDHVRGAPTTIDEGHRPVSRVSISLPEHVLQELDQMVEARGYASRSRAITEILHRSLADDKSHRNEVMVGIVTLYYDNSVKGLQQELSALQSRFIDECISSLHVHLAHEKTMEVILVQGPARKLHEIADMMITKRGVVSGKVHLMAAVIPPLHPFPKA